MDANLISTPVSTKIVLSYSIWTIALSILFYDYDVICNYIYSTFNADYGGSGKICGLGELSCLQKISKDLRKISQGNNVALQELRDAGIDCECPAGNLINVKLNKQN